MSAPDRRLLAGLLFLLSTVGLSGNVAVVATFIRYKRFHNAAYIWMGAIALMDMGLCMTLGYYPALGILLNSDLGDFVKRYWSLVHPWFNMVSFYSGLNINRFLCICMPYGHWLAEKAMDMKLTCIIIALIAIFNAVFSFFIFVKPAVVYFMPELYALGYNTTIPEAQLSLQVSTYYVYHDQCCSLSYHLISCHQMTCVAGNTMCACCR